MSGYLAHLVERSFAPATQIRPQIASLFETPSAVAAIDSPPAFNHTVETNADQPRTTLSPELPQSPPTRSTNQADAEPHSIRPEPRASIPRTITQQHDFAASVDSSFINDSTGTQADAATRRIDSDRSPRNLPRSGTLTDETIGHAWHSRSADAAPDRGVIDSSLHPREPSPAEASARHLSSSVNEAPTVRPAIRPSPSVREELFRSGPQNGRKESRSLTLAANQTAAPSIQVTIGRVEVRVIPPATPAKSAQKKEPQLSLDAYLQHRTQGGGR